MTDYRTFVAERFLKRTESAEGLIHVGVGMIGEVAEYYDARDRHHQIEELGDIEFYLEQMRQNLKITRQECLDANIVKLQKRYSTGYSNESAQARVDKQVPTGVGQSLPPCPHGYKLWLEKCSFGCS